MNIEKVEKDEEETNPNPKKLKIKIKPKPKNEIIIQVPATTVPNLVQDNIDILNETLSKELLEDLTRKYGYKEDKENNKDNRERNVYNFIEAYREVIKKQWNMETKFTDYRLFHDITSNPEKIKVVWGGCLQGLKRLPNESVGHIVTSPPYYNAREYSIWANLKAYLDDMREIITEC